MQALSQRMCQLSKDFESHSKNVEDMRCGSYMHLLHFKTPLHLIPVETWLSHMQEPANYNAPS